MMKSRTTTALLALFLGGLGAHRLYLGKIFTGLLYLFFCWTYIPAILGIIESIYYFWLTDAEFNASHNKGAVFVNQDVATIETHVKCPDCAELIRKEAKVCKHCGLRLTPQE